MSTKKKQKVNQPNIVWRGSREKITHHFKAMPADCTINRSWQYGVLKLDKEIPHSHFFHTTNSRFQDQKYTATVAGHYHEIEWFVDENGKLKAKCGPAIETKSRKTPLGYKKEKKRRGWYDAENDRMYFDEHTHEMEYIDSEMLNEDSIRGTQRNNQQAVLAQNPSPEVKVTAPAPMEGFAE